jgi:NADPH-dependent 2,4-dienoyl-CoA reductase/sulfur reductase-like enzyme
MQHDSRLGGPTGALRLVKTETSEYQAVVVGAGPSGVAVPLSLRDRGLRPLLIDRAAAIGSSWRGRYDRLKLNTCKQFSHLPDWPYPKNTPVFPTRDQVVDHLDRHARDDGIELRLNTPLKPSSPGHTGIRGVCSYPVAMNPRSVPRGIAIVPRREVRLVVTDRAEVT